MLYILFAGMIFPPTLIFYKNEKNIKQMIA